MSNVRYGPDEITNQTCPMRVAESALFVVQLTAVENPNGDVVVANQQACDTSVHGETGVVAPTQRMRNTDSGRKQRAGLSLSRASSAIVHTVSEIKAARGSHPPNFSASASACSFFSTPHVNVIIIITAIVPFLRILFPCGASPVPFSLPLTLNRPRGSLHHASAHALKGEYSSTGCGNSVAGSNYN